MGEKQQMANNIHREWRAFHISVDISALIVRVNSTLHMTLHVNALELVSSEFFSMVTKDLSTLAKEMHIQRYKQGVKLNSSRLHLNQFGECKSKPVRI